MKPTQSDQLYIPNGGTLVIYRAPHGQVSDLAVVSFPQGVVYSEWTPTDEEYQSIVQGRPLKIKHWQWNGGNPLQPVLLEIV